MAGPVVAVVGGGQAGASVVARLKAKGFTGLITLFAGEPVLPYQRPPLSKKYLSGEWQADRLLLHPPSFWQEAGIDTRLGCKVLAIDAPNRRLETEAGPFAWDHLVLATGTRPRPRPTGFAGRSNVFELRTLADVDDMRPHFRLGARLLVLGGGYVGLETAAVAVSAGLNVTVIEAASRILERVACDRTAAEIRALHSARGTRIIEGQGVAETLGEQRLQAVRLDDGTTIPLDFAVVGIGVLPRTELAESAGIVCDNGIRVDGQGRTSHPGIWAAGDCTCFDLDGQPTRLESVQNAIDQAEVVADAIMGGQRPYRPVPWFWSDQFDMKLQIAGLNRGYDDVVARSSDRGRSVWYLRADRLIAVDALNDARAFMAAKRMLETGIPVSRAQIEAPDFDPVRLSKAGAGRREGT